MSHANCDIFSGAERYRDYAPTIMRIVVGIFFIVHGFGKLWGAPGIAGWTAAVNGMLGLPAFFAYLVAIVEFLGGIFLVVGFLTRYAVIPLAITMIVAFFVAHLPNGVMDGELVLTFLAVLIALFLTGPGALSVEGMCRHQQNKERKPERRDVFKE